MYTSKVIAVAGFVVNSVECSESSNVSAANAYPRHIHLLISVRYKCIYISLVQNKHVHLLGVAVREATVSVELITSYRYHGFFTVYLKSTCFSRMLEAGMEVTHPADYRSAS